MPPNTASVERPVCAPRTLASASIWTTSSRVGAMTRALGPRGAFSGLERRRRVKVAIRKAAVFPGKEWERIEKPELVGYSSARLQALRGWVQSLDTTAMMVSVGGRVLFEYGDLTHQSYLASVRKSVLAILYGKYVENGTINLDKTLRELEFTDVGGLTPQELDQRAKEFFKQHAAAEPVHH